MKTLIVKNFNRESKARTQACNFVNAWNGGTARDVSLSVEVGGVLFEGYVKIDGHKQLFINGRTNNRIARLRDLLPY